MGNHHARFPEGRERETALGYSTNGHMGIPAIEYSAPQSGHSIHTKRAEISDLAAYQFSVCADEAIRAIMDVDNMRWQDHSGSIRAGFPQ